MARTATKNGGSSRFQLLPQTLLKQWRTYLRLTLGSPSHRSNFLGFLLLTCCVVLGTSAISQDKPAAAADQTTTQANVDTGDQVHITPRKEPDPKPPADLIDPALKTHTRPMKVDVDLVLVPVTVTDPMNRLVTGLEKDNFELYEGSDKQQVMHFSSEDAPISLGVIFDMSGSMSNKIEKSREAVVEFFRTANPQDEFFMVTFNEKPELLEDFTSSVEDIQAKLPLVAPKGRTALLDAIYMGIHRMKKAHNAKKALLIISDGGDNHSRYTESEIKSIVKEADVQIYAIGIVRFNAADRRRKIRSDDAFRNYGCDRRQDLHGRQSE